MPVRGKQASRTGLTPVLRALLYVTSDGQRHTREELHEAIRRVPGADDQSSISTVKVQVFRLRAIVRHWGQDIVCETAYGQITYRRVVVYRPEVHRHTDERH